MTSQERRNFNALKKAQRDAKRRGEAKIREAKRLAEADRIKGLRLQGTLLDEHAKKVKAAFGKKAIAKQRAEAERLRKAREAGAVALAKMQALKVKSEASNPQYAQRQEPKTIEGVPGSVVGRITRAKIQTLAAEIGDAQNATVQAISNWSGMTDSLGVIGELERFEGTEFEDCIAPLGNIQGLLATLQVNLTAISDALGAMDVGGLVSEFNESKRGRK